MNRKSLLVAFYLLTTCLIGVAKPETTSQSFIIISISSIKDFVSYFDIMLYLLSLLLLVPFAYLGYLKNRKIHDNKIPYHFKGVYNSKQLIDHVEGLELLFCKRFHRFKKLLEQFGQDSAGDMRKHNEVINSILLCIKLNGRTRLTAFWDLSDIFLKIMILLLPLIGLIVVLISNIYFGLGGLVMSLFAMLFIIPVMLVMFSHFLRIAQYIFGRTSKTVPALSLAFIAIESLINTNVSRSRDDTTGEFFYYTTIHKNNNEVNANTRLSSVYVTTSSMIYGDLKKQALSD